MGKAEDGYRWEEGGVRGREQSEARANPHRTYSEGKVPGGRKGRNGWKGGGRRGAEWMWNKLILQPHNKKDEW